jgi:hypothetical protein
MEEIFFFALWVSVIRSFIWILKYEETYVLTFLIQDHTGIFFFRTVTLYLLFRLIEII